ncbi:unnamed protein product [Dibothriocephalus latus]|uniref:C2H2-type domain-containing protein n=1 Tax=Dibothriocephalus latus TaxID=60516 RepID=A0A3P7LL35_DIBLA|nr:unnamed protein product [Dibothriocephalus latus]
MHLQRTYGLGRSFPDAAHHPFDGTHFYGVKHFNSSSCDQYFDDEHPHYGSSTADTILPPATSPLTLTTHSDASPPATTLITTAESSTRTGGSSLICPHCNRTLTPRIGLVGHLRIYRTETGRPLRCLKYWHY